jgi:hypothetical protein
MSDPTRKAEYFADAKEAYAARASAKEAYAARARFLAELQEARRLAAQTPLTRNEAGVLVAYVPPSPEEQSG